MSAIHQIQAELREVSSMTELFDRLYYPYTDSDSECNAIALDKAFHALQLAKPFLFTIYLGLGIETAESILWLTETFFVNNPDIPFD
jgi:hypothetical protein